MSEVELASVSARGRAERGRGSTSLASVSFRAQRGVHGVIGAHKDGTALLFDVLDGTVKPRSGRVDILGGTPDAMRARLARVSLEAPLPDALRVAEVCDLAADIRAEARRPASERLAVLGIAGLADRRVRTLSIEQRRTVALAIALTSNVDVLLVEEPLLALDRIAPRLVIDALRARAATACVIVTTASPRDATQLADHVGILTAGIYSPLAENAHALGGSMRVVVSPSHGSRGATALVAALSNEAAVLRVETSTHASRPGVSVLIVGTDLLLLAKAVTRAIHDASVDVDLIEPITPSLTAVQSTLVARAPSLAPSLVAERSPPAGVSSPPSPESSLVAERLPPAGVSSPGSLPSPEPAASSLDDSSPSGAVSESPHSDRQPPGGAT